jgi:hypothetical protein
MSPGRPTSVFGRWLLGVASGLVALAALGCADVPSGDSAGSTAPVLSSSTAATAASTSTTAATITTTSAAPTTATTAAPTTATTAAPTTTVSASTTTSGSPPDRRPAPGFRGTTLSGAEVSLESYAGKPLVLVFWWSG